MFKHVLVSRESRMAEKEKPIWKHRRFYGGILGTLGAALIAVPGAPVIATIGAVSITTTVLGILLTGIGTHVFSYGQGAANERKKGK
jgi:hypothetical protein